MTQRPDATEPSRQQYRLPVQKLYPNLPDEQLEEAEYFFNQYLEVIHRIFEENQQKKPGVDDF